jgi:plasmid stability protein
MVPKWIYNGTMPRTVTLSVKNVPADLAKRLKERAARNNRSLQGELLSILKMAANNSEAELAVDRPLTLSDLSALARSLGMKSEVNESTQAIGEERDRRSR